MRLPQRGEPRPTASERHQVLAPVQDPTARQDAAPNDHGATHCDPHTARQTAPCGTGGAGKRDRAEEHDQRGRTSLRRGGRAPEGRPLRDAAALVSRRLPEAVGIRVGTGDENLALDWCHAGSDDPVAVVDFDRAG